MRNRSLARNPRCRSHHVVGIGEVTGPRLQPFFGFETSITNAISLLQSAYEPNDRTDSYQGTDQSISTLRGSRQRRWLIRRGKANEGASRGAFRFSQDRNFSVLPASTPRSHQFRGCSAQTCDLNALSRCVSYPRFNSSIDLSPSRPDPLNSHPQTEQAQPWNCSRSTHTISRAKEHLRQERVCGGRHHDASWTSSQAR